ncbi:GDSL esterase/lipase At1g71250 [Linum perenne]
MQTVYNSTAAAAYISRSVYYIFVGGGGSIANQLDNLIFSDPSFINEFTSEYITYIQALYAIGARKFGVVAPLQAGCTPAGRAYSPTSRCNARANSIAAAISSSLALAMSMLRATNQDMIYSIGNTYNINADITNSPALYGKCSLNHKPHKKCYNCVLWKRDKFVHPECYRVRGSRWALVLGSISTNPKWLEIGCRRLL